MRKLYLLLLVFPLIVVGHLVYLYTHREFRPDEFKHSVTIEAPLIDKTPLEKILNQKFTYLGLGKQMTAYESEDHQFVLKLFNPRTPLKEKWFHDWKKLGSFCSLKWLSSAYFKRKQRLQRLFERYALAFREIREETGLVYVHLNALTAVDQTAHLIDRDGKSYLIDLKYVPFVLQRKAELAAERLKHLQDQKEIEEVFRELKVLFITRANKGITDRIQTMHNNYGFLDGKAIQIDVGRICLSETVKSDPFKEVERITENLQIEWPILRKGNIGNKSG